LPPGSATVEFPLALIDVTFNEELALTIIFPPAPSLHNPDRPLLAFKN